MLTQPENDIYPTFIMGTLTLSQNDDSEKAANFEGIYFTAITHKNISKARFLKCHFSNFYKSGNGEISQCVFIQCIFNKCYLYGDAQLFNCLISNSTELTSHTSTTTTNNNFSYQNCVIIIESVTEVNSRNKAFNNCIFIPTSNSAYLYDGNTNTGNIVYNCVCVGTTNFFKNVKNSTNRNIDSSIDFFTNGLKYIIQDDSDFSLTEAAAETYLGGDGTQVGMYGGSFPFDPIPTGLRITKFNVAPKSTVDGKLSIDISVSIPE